MARAPITINRLSRNSSIAGGLINDPTSPGDTNDVNAEARLVATNAGIGTKGISGPNSKDAGYFEILEAYPEWYFRDNPELVPTRVEIFDSDSTTDIVRFRFDTTEGAVQATAGNNATHSGLKVRLTGSAPYTYLTPAEFNALIPRGDTDSDPFVVEVGDSVITVGGDAEGGIITKIYDDSDGHVRFDVRLTAGSGLGGELAFGEPNFPLFTADSDFIFNAGYANARFIKKYPGT